MLTYTTRNLKYTAVGHQQWYRHPHLRHLWGGPAANDQKDVVDVHNLIAIQVVIARNDIAGKSNKH